MCLEGVIRKRCTADLPNHTTGAVKSPPIFASGCTAYKFRSNSDLCLTGDLRQMLPGVIAYGIQFDLNLYCTAYKFTSNPMPCLAQPTTMSPEGQIRY